MSTQKNLIRWILAVCLIISACDMNVFRKKMPDAETFFEEPRALALAKAIEKGDTKAIQQSASKLDINQQHVRGMTFLNWAFAHLNYESTELLLELGADPHIETEDVSPLSFAMDHKDIRWLKLFVESGADVNRMGNSSPLWFSTMFAGNWPHFDYLLEKGVDVNAATDIGSTAIFRLASLREYGQVLKLIEKGANIQVETSGGLSFAREVQDSEVATDHPEYENREKVITLLEQKGIHFPVPSAKEVREQRSKNQ